jgi:L,D-transpeptidase catalytic domain
MWKHSGRQRSRRRLLPVLIGIAGVAACVFGGTYWTGTWIFRKRLQPVELAATTTLPTWTEPAKAPEPPPAAAADYGPAEPGDPPFSRSETRDSQEAIALAQAAEAELKGLRGGDPDVLRRKVGVLAIDDRYPADARAAWLVEARDLSRRVVFSASPMKSATMVPVGRGDTLLEICQKLRKDKVVVTPKLIEMVNDVTAQRLRAGMKLKVPTETLSILVDKGEFRLYVLLGGVYVKDYPVGIGRDQRTPEGRFTIQSKTKNPQWTDPETGKIHQYGEPGHVIGSRWMGFAGEHGRTGFGIHGTTEPHTIGRAESAGCIRMTRDDVEEVFDLVPQGSDVTIRR